MDTNNIIDAELTNKQLLSSKGMNFLKVSGYLSMLMGIVVLIQVLSSFFQMISEVISLASYMDMGDYRYYILVGLLNRLITMVFSVFATIYLFRYAALATKGDKTSFNKMEWTTIFESLRNIIVIYGLMNIVWFLFSILNLFIGMLIN